MTMYAKVIDGVIVKTQTMLPRSTENVSNFYLMPENKRRLHGWYTVIEDSATSPNYHVTHTEFSFDGKDVIETKTFIPIALADAKAKAIFNLKENASNTLLATYPLFKQVNAAMDIYDAPKKQEIKAAIEAVRATVDVKEAQINACSSVAEINAIGDIQ